MRLMANSPFGSIPPKDKATWPSRCVAAPPARLCWYNFRNDLNPAANSPGVGAVLEPDFAKLTARLALALPNWSSSLPTTAVYRPVICAYVVLLHYGFRIFRKHWIKSIKDLSGVHELWHFKMEGLGSR
jgi:hypothetical protein